MEDADLKQKTLYTSKHNVTRAAIAEELCRHSGEHRTVTCGEGQARHPAGSDTCT